MPTAALIQLLIQIIPMLPAAADETVKLVQMVKSLISGSNTADQAVLQPQWDAMRARVLAADAAWQSAGV
jgi:hypothetical protein